MCGISGIFSLKQEKKFPADWLIQMHQLLRHRGPDGSGLVLFDGTDSITYANALHEHKSLPYSPVQGMPEEGLSISSGMAHNRLAIVDLTESGHQPLCDASGRFWIVFNGEIYNHPELRSLLQQKGHRFLSLTDTEVVLKMYEEFGEECTKHFNGMWAFVIFDSHQKRMFASRDRLGVKPFYYAMNGDYFAFASETKALLPFCRNTGLDTSANPHAVLDYFVFTRIEEGKSNWYKNILELKAGKSLKLDLQKHSLHVSTHYTPRNEELYHHEKSVNWYMDRLEGAFNQSVALRLRSDVEVGACLSGGIDSSLIVASACMQTRKPMKVFTARFPDKKYDESHYAKMVADKFKCPFFLTEIDANEVRENLLTLAYCQDFPIWSTSTFLQFRLMKLASENGIKVLLDGQGGDELFGGYPHHALYVKNENAFRERVKFYSKLFLIKMFNQLPGTHAKKAMLHRMYPVTRFLDNTWLLDALKDWKAWLNVADSLNEQLSYEAGNSLLKLYLRCEDRCSMHYSIESRTPFSDDPELLSMAFQIPGFLKVHNGMHKYILRKTFKDYLPADVVIRTDKKGFSTPNREWILQNLNFWMDDFFNSTAIPELKMYAIRKHYSGYVKSGDSGSPHLFKPIAFAAWHKVYHDRPLFKRPDAL